MWRQPRAEASLDLTAFIVDTYSKLRQFGVKKKNSLVKKIFEKTYIRRLVSPFLCFEYFSMGKKGSFLAIWPYSPNYASNNIFDFFNVFVDHKNIGKEIKFTVLSCTV